MPPLKDRTQSRSRQSLGKVGRLKREEDAVDVDDDAISTVSDSFSTVSINKEHVSKTGVERDTFLENFKRDRMMSHTFFCIKVTDINEYQKICTIADE